MSKSRTGSCDDASETVVPLASKPNYPPIFPLITSLKAEVLTENSTKWIPCIPNGREATPFETEFFKGTAMLIIRTAPVDEFFKSFFGGKRQFEVQVQGKFKRMPMGEIYIGAEVSKKMELGMFTRSICRAALKFCGTMVNDLHYSFGDAQDDPNYQLPHLVAPIFPTFDKILVTPPGEPLPPMGIPFKEDLEYRKQRLKYRFIDDANVNLDYTYSFSVNTSNVNLLDWTLVGIPMVRPMDLRTFYGNSHIHLIGYEIPRSVAAVTDTHPHKKLNYVFNMKLVPVDPEAAENPQSNSSDDEEEDLLEDAQAGPSSDAAVGEDRVEQSLRSDSEEKVLLSKKSRITANVDLFGVVEEPGEGEEEATDEDDFADKEDEHAATPDSTSQVNKKGGGVSGWLRRHITSKRISHPVSSHSAAATSTTSVTGTVADGEGEVVEGSEYSMTDYDLESSGDLKFCPACIELNDYRKEGKRRVLYFMPVYDNNTVAISHAHTGSGGASTQNKDSDNEGVHHRMTSVDPLVPRLKAYSDIAKEFNLVAIPLMHKNKRLSSNEKRRRQIVETYRTIVRQSNMGLVLKLNSFLSQPTVLDRNFLNGNQDVLHRSVSKQGTDVWEGNVALATSRRHWSEQYMTLSKAEVVFYNSSESRRVIQRIPLGLIVSVAPMRLEEVPTQGFSFFQIETFSRIYYLMVRSDLQLNVWLQAFITLLGSTILMSPFDFNTGTGAPAHIVPAPGVKAGTHGSRPTSATTAIHHTTSTSTSTATIGAAGITSSTHSSTSSSYSTTTSPAAATAGSAHPPNITNPVFNTMLDNVEDDLYLAKSACWKLDKKRIFNYRRIIFNPHGLPEHLRNINPNELIESCLKAAFELSKNSETHKTTAFQWVKFLDEISLLQTMNITHLSEMDRIAFFLNLYHVMIIHGNLTLGPPPSWNYWNAFFNNISYLIAYDVITIGDVDHNILRAAMSRPSSLSVIPVPFSLFPGLAITHRDFRFNFCINNGSRSMPEAVPIYRGETLDRQLDEMTHIMLSNSVEIDIHRKVVIIPKVSLQDFACKKGSSVTGLDCLRNLAHYLRKEDKTIILRMLLDPLSNITVRFKNPSLRCRMFKQHSS